MSCLQSTCGISLHDHVPIVDILNRCNTCSVEFQLQSKILRWLGHVFRMSDDRAPGKLSFGEVQAFAHLVALGLVLMMLWYMTVKTVVSVGHLSVKPCRNAQDKLLSGDKTCTYQAHLLTACDKHVTEGLRFVITWHLCKSSSGCPYSV